VFSKKCISLWAIIITALVSITSLQSDQIDIMGGVGLVPLTDEEKNLLEFSIGKIIEIAPNELGSQRIQSHLASQGLLSDQMAASASSPECSIMQGTIAQALEAMPPAAILPRSVNNSLLSAFPPIGHQGFIQASVPFSTTYYQASHEIARVNGTNNKLSFHGILSPKWTYNLINDGIDAGSSPIDALNLLSGSGAPSLTSFPYDGNYTQWSTYPDDWINALSHRMAPWSFIPGLGGAHEQNLTAIKQALVNGHIVTFGTFIYSWRTTRILPDSAFPESPYVGQWAAYWMQGTLGPHLMTIVGYDDDLWIDVNQNGVVDAGEHGAFLVANSWGTLWGNDGFIWISYDAFLAASAVAGGPNRQRVPLASPSLNGVYFTTPKAPFYTPHLIAQFSITQTSRYPFNVALGASSHREISPTLSTPLTALSHRGGSRAFNGSARSSIPQTATFAADLSDFLAEGLQTAEQKYHLSLKDNGAGDPTIVNSFSLIDRVHDKVVTSTQVPLYLHKEQKNLSLDYSFLQPRASPAIYLNAGGPSVSFDGISWTSDESYQIDSLGVYRRDVSVDNPVYSTERFGNMLYTFEVPNGVYAVILKFAEIFSTSAGQRVFNVSINGVEVISQLDLFEKAGFGVPYDVTFPITVANQNITIQFFSIKDNAKINAIQIIQHAM
jgi:hypothetical protein